MNDLQDKILNEVNKIKSNSNYEFGNYLLTNYGLMIQETKSPLPKKYPSMAAGFTEAEKDWPDESASATSYHVDDADFVNLTMFNHFDNIDKYIIHAYFCNPDTQLNLSKSQVQINNFLKANNIDDLRRSELRLRIYGICSIFGFVYRKGLTTV